MFHTSRLFLCTFSVVSCKYELNIRRRHAEASARTWSVPNAPGCQQALRQRGPSVPSLSLPWLSSCWRRGPLGDTSVSARRIPRPVGGLPSRLESSHPRPGLPRTVVVSQLPSPTSRDPSPQDGRPLSSASRGLSTGRMASHPDPRPGFPAPQREEGET